MPEKRLPEGLVKRLRQTSSVVNRRLGRMKSVDRRSRGVAVSLGQLMPPGQRVREMKVSRNYPGLELVLKRAHAFPGFTGKDVARLTIIELNKIVRLHNQQCVPERYVLKPPYLYAVGRDLIAMAKTDSPTVNEVLFSGQRFLEKHAVTKRQLRAALKEFTKATMKSSKTSISSHNLLVTGFKKGKFVFMPLADLF
ncbi:MAG: hypothetical protein ACE5DI_05210 [Candidatus Micrarchaeia archaeon]